MMPVNLSIGEPISGLCEQFAELGHDAPFRILSPKECRDFLNAINDPHNPPPMDWNKGYAASSRVVYEVGTHPTIIERVSALLGADVMLWGASMQDRTPGAVHPWHSDIESWPHPDKTVSVWIGLENTTRESSLKIIPYSHRLGVTVQQVRHELGRARDENTDDDVVSWAQARDERSHLLSLDMADGEGIILDGQIWHGSRNLSGETRRALLLQYATPDAEIRIPDLNHLDWPFRQYSFPKPPCIMVKGTAKTDSNLIVSPPVAAMNVGASDRLTGRVWPLQLPLELDETDGWKPYFLFDGSTPELTSLTCHVSVLKQGHCPHPPHAHEDEELLLLLRGEVELTLPDDQTAEASYQRRLNAGQFVYYPENFSHTLKTVSDEPANYLMFKWRNRSRDFGSHLAFGQFDIFERQQGSARESGFSTQLVFEGSTPYLRKFHCHTSTLTPSAGYEPHIDSHDVAIFTLEGEVEILGERVGPHSVIFCPAGEPHGISNPGEVVAKYIVFEFHGNQTAQVDSLPRPRSLLTKLTDPHSWRRKLKHLVWASPNKA